MNDFDIIDLQPGDPQYVRAQAENSLTLPAGLEDALRRFQWFDYKPLAPIEATAQFVRAYDQAMTSLLRKNAEIPDKVRDHLIRRNGYLSSRELLAPWIDPKAKDIKLNARWTAWVSARRSADKRGMKYEDYCYGAIIGAFRRGWPRLPQPNALTNSKLLGCDPDDRWPDATVQGYEAKIYAQTVKRADSPHFQASSWLGLPDQVIYLKYLGKEMMRVYGPNSRAERAWRLMQDQGYIHSSQSLRDLIY